jgi:hypothetical protein
MLNVDGSDCSRPEASSPLHRLTLAITEGIGLEVADKGVPPPQPRRPRSLLLPAENLILGTLEESSLLALVAGGKHLDHQNEATMTKTTVARDREGSAEGCNRPANPGNNALFRLREIPVLEKERFPTKGKTIEARFRDLCCDPARDQRAEILLLSSRTPKASQSGPIQIQVRTVHVGRDRFTRRTPQKGKGTRSTDARPGDYPLGSAQSRAAARSLLTFKRAMEGEGTMFVLEALGSPAPPGTKCTCPIPPAGSFGFCSCFYPAK